MAPAKKAAAKPAAKPAKKSAAKKAPDAKKKPAAKNSAADAIDHQLARYQSMRDFNVTAEPSGKEKAGAKLPANQYPFVIQKHAASHLHYDFRLGWNGVLKSWAVAKGPSYVTADKRLAVQVEDHPLEYGGFEGIIPKGQYGGGTVMIWDEGTWEPQPAYPDVDAGLRDGSLKFILHGAKLKGKWALIRMKPRPKETKPTWLLIKEHDPFERTPSDPAITEEEPNSVVTGRSLEQIAAQEDHVWNSKDTADPKGKAWHRNDSPAASRPTARSSKPIAPLQPASTRPVFNLKDAPKESLPTFIPPQLASQATTPPSGGWLHELKLDGYRIQARKNGSQVELLTRTGLDWTYRMKTIAAQIAALPAQSAILDGEVVVLAPDGTTSFADLQAAFQEGVKKPLTYFVFDLLHLSGHNLRGLPLLERKNLLAQLLASAGEFLHYSEHLEGDGAPIFRSACELHAEGIVSKRAAGRYISGRSSEWLKLKCIHEQEFVIGGFTLPAKGHTGIHGIGSLLLGYYDKSPSTKSRSVSKEDQPNLIYAGRTGTGFTQKTHAILRTALDKLRTATNPFFKPPAEARNGIIPVKPTLVAQVNFATWTADNLVRQASFKGLREDKPASEVRREEPAPKPRAAKHASHSESPPVAAKTAPAAKSAATGKKQTAADPEHPPIRLTHPDKILDPESHLTKQQLADYYWFIAPCMLPQIAGRPISIVRCPDGATKQCFFQKHVNATLPRGIGSVDVPDKKTGKVEPYITISTPENLASLAQLGVLEIHPWGSHNDDLEHPDRIIFDLDPDTAISWPTLAAAADEIRKRLKKLGLESFLKLTGGKGLHVVAPIQPDHDWNTVKEFAHALVLQMEKENPRVYLTVMTKSARAGKIYLDYLRNERGATAVAAFSPRARPGANVSMPLAWSELKLDERPIFAAADYATWRSRLKRDPWKQLPLAKQRITNEALAALKVSP